MSKIIIKYLLATLLLLFLLPALAIASGVEQANDCANYTTDPFCLTTNGVSIANFCQSSSNYLASYRRRLLRIKT